MGIIPRAPSPTYEEEESADVFELDPELARIRAQIRSQSDSFETPASQDTGGPPTVAVKVRWIPHPQNPAARSDVWGFKLNRVRRFPLNGTLCLHRLFVIISVSAMRTNASSHLRHHIA